MSAPRLTFLYPHLFRRPFAVEVSSRLETGRPQQTALRRRRRALHFTSRHRYEIQPTSSTPSDGAIPLPRPGAGQSASDRRAREEQDETGRSERDDGGEDERLDGNIIDVTPSRKDPQSDASESHPAEPQTSTSLELSTRPLERVLQMDPPSARSDDDKPHLRAPPYVHHFDTYSLVRDLQIGGFSQHQSISLMKAVRGLLATNMQLAREGLVSKSDVENEGYLFGAACSELKTEVQNSRRIAADKMRSERAHLQHEVDILGQRVTQESASLKEELKGVFDDRKMVVRHEQRMMDSRIQELNYKIQSVLTGQSKGEVEGLRWFLTRRAAIFIGGLAVAVIVGIQYSVHNSHAQQLERQRLKESSDEARSVHATTGSYTTASRSTGTQTSENTDALMQSMDTPTGQNYVSLG